MKALFVGLLVVGSMILSSFKITPDPTTYTVTISVNNIRNNKGQLQFKVFKDQDSFADEVAYKIYRIPKKNVSNGRLTCTLKGLPPGTYGVAMIDDENANKEMDFGLMFPKEGFGFSDYYHTSSISRPVFDDFKFKLDADKKVSVKVRYM